MIQITRLHAMVQKSPEQYIVRVTFNGLPAQAGALPLNYLPEEFLYNCDVPDEEETLTFEHIASNASGTHLGSYLENNIAQIEVGPGSGDYKGGIIIKDTKYPPP